MSYIAPNTKIWICAGVPLDPTYDHTLYWLSEGAQKTYFESKVKNYPTSSAYKFNNQSYQRCGRNKIRLEVLADDLYDCNYLMFQNTAFGNKWFYAFLSSVEYINNHVTEITYEIDVMQTWFFAYTLNPCWVIREHVDDDAIGKHTEPETLNLGPMIYTDLGDMLYSKTTNHAGAKLTAVVLASVDGNRDNYYGGVYCGVYSGLACITYSLDNNASLLTNFLTDIVDNNQQSSIYKIFLVPNYLLPDANNNASHTNISYTKADLLNWNYSGYPKNNKLYTYPYTALYITNNNGSGSNYAIERFSNDYCAFDIKGCLTAQPELSCSPKNYNGVSVNTNERILLDVFPECSWSSDYFMAWLAGQGRIELAADFQGFANEAVTAVRTSVNADTSKNPQKAMGDSIQLGANAIYDGLEIANKCYVYDSMPPQLHGKSTNGINVDVDSSTGVTGSNTLVGFRAYVIHVREEYMLKIDNFFSRFGYSCNRLKEPNRDVRENWTYTRTSNCTLTAGLSDYTSGLPADDEAKICSIYDRGITFWRNPANVGNYGLSNNVSIRNNSSGSEQSNEQVGESTGG